jgi:hypothetical protein
MPDYFSILRTFYSQDEFSIDNNDYSTLQWFSDNPKPTQEELDALWIPTQDSIAKQNCKKQASALLYETDWTTIPDVASPTNSPYLANQAEFFAYRNSLRQLAVNPVVNPVFPTKPTEVWA